MLFLSPAFLHSDRTLILHRNHVDQARYNDSSTHQVLSIISFLKISSVIQFVTGRTWNLDLLIKIKDISFFEFLVWLLFLFIFLDFQVEKPSLWRNPSLIKRITTRYFYFVKVLFDIKLLLIVFIVFELVSWKNMIFKLDCLHFGSNERGKEKPRVLTCMDFCAFFVICYQFFCRFSTNFRNLQFFIYLK